jgi:hypothetical protein
MSSRADLRTGQPAAEQPRRAIDRGLRGRRATQVPVPRVVVAAIVTLVLAALMATQLGYTQRMRGATRIAP